MEPRFENRYHREICRTATHIYLLPHPSLQPLVAHYTLCLTSGGFTAEAQRVLTLIPDASGCLVLTLSEEAPGARMYGPSTVATTVSGAVDSAAPLFFVEFKPGGLFALTGIPQDDLRDRVWPLEEVAPALLRPLWDALGRAVDLDEFIRRADAALAGAVRYPAPAGPMLAYLAGDWARCSAEHLARETGYSPRHLSRLFREGAGMGYKSFLRVLRINEAARRIRAGETAFTALAQELGYYDQAHFIHDFKSVCALPPGEYRKSLSDFYNEPLKF